MTPRGATNRTTISRPTTRDAWLDARRPYFNASSASILWDRHPYQTPADVAVGKLSATEQSSTRAMRRGQYMENAVAEWFAYEYGVDVREPDVLFIADRVMATADRWSDVLDRPVEIKTASGYLSEPEQYWLDQCQAVMFCTGADHIELVWVDSSLDMQHVTLDHDEAFTAELSVRAERFMAAIDLGMVPDWIVPELTAHHVALLHPDPAGEVELPDEAVELVERYVSLRSTKGVIEREMDEIKSRVAVQLGEHEYGVRDGERIVSFKSIADSEVVDTKRLIADHPDIVRQYIETRPGGRRFVAAL